MNHTTSILLIEDDIDDQEFFLEAVSNIENASVSFVACNGTEAIALLRNSYDLPDIIFSDIQMPGMDGLECLAELKKNSLTKNIPVVMLSSSLAHTEKAISLGAKAFINKTSNYKSLCQQLSKFIKPGFDVTSILPRNLFEPRAAEYTSLSY
jgi:CheY-like chemotaxis protein